jgi:hypothetical protein
MCVFNNRFTLALLSSNFLFYFPIIPGLKKHEKQNTALF